MVALIKAILRRVVGDVPVAEELRLNDGRLVIDNTRHEVLIDAERVSGTRVDLQSLAGHKTLLFYEGVGCQACIVQAADLQNAKAPAGAGIRLVSVTTDPVGDLAQAASQDGIRTPLLADPTTTISAAYGMLGHGGTGHPTQDRRAAAAARAARRQQAHPGLRAPVPPPGSPAT